MTNTAVIDRQVRAYKNAKLKTQKDRAFETIIKVLNNHIRQIKTILLGYDDPGISPEVKHYMLTSMMATTKEKDQGMFLLVVRSIIQSQGFTKEDVEQMIYLEILKLLEQYKYYKVSFLQYVTYLLPRRIQSKVWKLSKDQLSQIYTQMDYTDDLSYIDSFATDSDEPEDIEEDIERQLQYSFAYKQKMEVPT